MKKLIILIIIVLSTTSILFAQKTPFEKFDSSKIDVGTMYVYEYSTNKENFQPSAKQYLYIKTLNDIEVMVVYRDTLELPDILKYTLNWDYMMLEKYYYKYTGTKNELPLTGFYKMNSNIDFQKKILESKNFGKAKNGRFAYDNSTHKLESIPTYFYQMTNLMPLWFALRFYPLNKKMITVNSMSSSGYNTKLEIKYEGKEKVKVPFGNVLCYKFELIPKLSFLMKLFYSPKKAFIWLTSEDSSRYMVKYRNNNAQYIIPSMEYRLAERKKMTPEEWEKFKEKHGAKDTNSTN